MLADNARDSWDRVRQAKPLVHCITNLVSMDIMANTLLAVGASPAMVLAEEEVEEFANFASVLLINVGTLTAASAAAMCAAAQAYNRLGKPWVLDPVAAGISAFRLQTIVKLLELKPTLIRGNASEVMTIAGASGAGGRGTDSTASPEEALGTGKQLAAKQGCIVAISGATDLVTDGRRVIRCRNGHPDMQNITATGCALTAVLAAFLASDPPDRLLVAAHALCVYGLSAEEHDQNLSPQSGRRGPATLRQHMIDWLGLDGDGTNVVQAARLNEDAQ